MQPTCCAELSPAERREFEERRLIGLVVVPGAEVPFRADYWRWRRRGDAGRHPGRDEDDQAEQQPTKIERKFESRVDRESREPVFEALHGYDERIDVLPDRDTWRSRLLNYVDEHATEIVTDLAGLVRMPSVSGSDDEIDIQHGLSDRMITMELAVETWQIPLDETFAEPDFPGVEVDRSEAWGVVGRVAGRGNGPSLMLNAHVDVVPPGDPLNWEGADPFSGRVTGDTVEGRGACDMKAGLVASLWAARGLTELKVA